MKNSKILLPLLLIFFSMVCLKSDLNKITGPGGEIYDISGSKAPDKIKLIIQNDIIKWYNSDIIVNSVIKANQENKNRSLNKVKELDLKWQSEAGLADFMLKYLSNDAANYLKNIIQKSDGKYSEIFIMDYQGCNVAMTSKTSDFWQGDEDKFTKSYNNKSIFIDRPELDQSTKTMSIQVSLPLIGKSSQKVIGVITIGIDINAL